MCSWTKRLLSIPRYLRLFAAASNKVAMSTSEERLAISLQDVREARERIREHVHYTPVMECSHLDSLSGYKLYFKCEQFQKTGAFKIRGATNAIMNLCSAAKKGADPPIIVTHSSGNHAQAIALAARTCGVPAHIVMPNTAPQVKIQAVKDYGGIVHLCEPSEEARYAAADELVRQYAPRAVIVHSSNHPDVMAGQGTVALEFLEQVPDLDTIVASVSCGGLMAGQCVVAKAANPGIKMVAAEPKNADDTARSIAAGYIIPNNPSYPETIADGLRMSVGDIVFPILQTHLSGVVTTTEEEIVAAMRLVWERMKVVIEPSAACTVAAVLKEDFRRLVGTNVKKVGVVLCGGNCNLDKIPWIK